MAPETSSQPSPSERASLATTRRLLAALVNEQLLPFHLATPPSPTAPVPADLKQAPSSSSSSSTSLRSIDFPLEIATAHADRTTPLLAFSAIALVREGDRVLYCDPEDVALALPIFLDGRRVSHPVEIFDAVAPFIAIATPALVLQARMELQSSVENQEISYECVKEAPLLSSPSIAWEQSIIEGHPVHPMHRSRLGMTLEESRRWTSEFQGRPEIHFVAIPKDQANVHGEFYETLGSWIPAPPSPDMLVIPIHEGQWKTITQHFPDAIKLPASKPSLALTSIRSVTPVDLDVQMKVALAIYTTSAMRTISPYSVFNGPRVGAVAKLLAPEPLKIIDEFASVGSNHPNPSVAKHLACLIRENPDVTMPNNRHVICASLVEKDCQGVPLVIASLGLHTVSQREEFLARYVDLFVRCFIPPMLKGLAFEAHGQNTLARFDLQGNLVGFSIRDFGGLKIHLPTLKSQGISLELLPGSSIVADDMEDVYRIIFHAGIQNHLHRMIRALDLHHNGKGWAMLRSSLTKVLGGSSTLDHWFSSHVHVKSLLAMKLTGLYNDFLYYEAPNYLALNGKGPQAWVPLHESPWMDGWMFWTLFQPVQMPK